MSHSICRWLPLIGLVAALPAVAGAPMLRETCVGADKQPVPTRYDAAATRFFAEARIVARGMPPVAIFVNPDRYFLGERTQQWLYQRQCVHIQQGHRIAFEGERGLQPEDEEKADCEGLRTLIQAEPPAARMLRQSIESDMQRVLRENRWPQVLPGPQRLIAFDRCVPPL
jgi:hypothetical protein